jgi:hypothetical protein
VYASQAGWTFGDDSKGNDWYVVRRNKAYVEVLGLYLLAPFVPLILIAWWKDILPTPPGCCPKCRYDLGGLPRAAGGSITCPECGHASLGAERAPPGGKLNPCSPAPKFGTP